MSPLIAKEFAEFGLKFEFLNGIKPSIDDYMKDKSKKCQLIKQTPEETLYEIKEDNEGE